MINLVNLTNHLFNMSLEEAHQKQICIKCM